MTEVIMERRKVNSAPANGKQTVLFLHGFFSSGSSVPAVAMREYLGDQYNVVTPDLPLNPHDALAYVLVLCEEHKPCMIVGNSCGAFYAQIASNMTGIPALLGNPYFKMSEFLKERMGDQEYKAPRADGNQTFVINDQLVEEFEELEAVQFKVLTPKRNVNVWGLFGENDTLAHFEPLFKEYYKSAYHFPGGHTPTAEEVRDYYVPLIDMKMEQLYNLRIICA